MHDYILLQSPDGAIYDREMQLIETSTQSERKRYERLVGEDWKVVGRIRTELSRQEIRTGIGYQFMHEAQLLRQRLREVTG
ncbi:MAG: hypothetical protein IJJ38_01065 [Lachnospiraceae bacterium]|nr:hypothetical protein [Lachnospiraceae bacterium]